MKALKLKYGEYYNLKITDSSKNVINNVEITGCQITTEQRTFSVPNYSNSENDKQRLADLMKGETRLQKLTAKKNSEELSKFEEDEIKELETEFYSWTYEKILSEKEFKECKTLLRGLPSTPNRTEEVPKHDLKCEIQVLERNRIKKRVEVPIIVRVPIKIFGLVLGYTNKQTGTRIEWQNTDEWTETYRWADEYTIPRIYEETLVLAKYNIDINQRLLNTSFSVNNSNDKTFSILNWRYKLTGGVIKIEKLQKEIMMDEESYDLRGKHSYSYPESTLIEANAFVDGESLVSHIGDHILKCYKDGRETMELTWQGDPTMTLGDSIVIEDKFGIEKEFMVTGNEFILENSGKFFMRTEGIFVIL